MWMQTYTGKKFQFERADMNDFVPEDIAHSLAMQPRYQGHCLEFYSIAEHCCLLHDFCIDRGFPLEVAHWALLHDAPEAYIGDQNNPLKVYLRKRDGKTPTNYDLLDGHLMALIAIRFGLQGVKAPPIIKEIDNRIRQDERSNMSECRWDDNPAPLGVKLHLWDWKTAKVEFLRRLLNLMASAPNYATGYRL